MRRSASSATLRALLRFRFFKSSMSLFAQHINLLFSVSNKKVSSACRSTKSSFDVLAEGQNNEKSESPLRIPSIGGRTSHWRHGTFPNVYPRPGRNRTSNASARSSLGRADAIALVDHDGFFPQHTSSWTRSVELIVAAAAERCRKHLAVERNTPRRPQRSAVHRLGLVQVRDYATCLFEPGRASVACEPFNRVCTRKA